MFTQVTIVPTKQVKSVCEGSLLMFGDVEDANKKEMLQEESMKQEIKGDSCDWDYVWSEVR